MLYITGDESELAAKKALAVLSELWRRKIWRDARTVNCIASAVFHKSPRVMAAALKFFLGQDSASGGANVLKRTLHADASIQLNHPPAAGAFSSSDRSCLTVLAAQWNTGREAGAPLHRLLMDADGQSPSVPGTASLRANTTQRCHKGR